MVDNVFGFTRSVWTIHGNADVVFTCIDPGLPITTSPASVAYLAYNTCNERCSASVSFVAGLLTETNSRTSVSRDLMNMCGVGRDRSHSAILVHIVFFSL